MTKPDDELEAQVPVIRAVPIRQQFGTSSLVLALIRISAFVICNRPFHLLKSHSNRIRNHTFEVLAPCPSAKQCSSRPRSFASRYNAVREQIGRVIVGHDDIVHGVLTCLFVGGHCLLEGVPGLGKTLLVRTLAEDARPQLLAHPVHARPDAGRHPRHEHGHRERPTAGGRSSFRKGPIFTQICLADEINRATPKTQSAMLETMQEGTVTVAGKRYELEKPFFVMATQNPIEQEGTYPLPEAQLDRFFFKLVVGYSQPRGAGDDHRPHDARRSTSSRTR